MKKIKMLVCGLLIIISVSGRSQSYANAFSGYMGVVPEGIAGLFSYNYFLDRHDYVEAGLFISAANFKYVENIKIPYNDFTLNVGYSKNVFWNYQNTFNVNISGGGIYGYETINRGDKELRNGALINSKPGFIYGAYIGLDLDYSITDTFSLTLRLNEFYHANSTLGEFLPFAGIGFRYYTN